VLCWARYHDLSLKFQASDVFEDTVGCHNSYHTSFLRNFTAAVERDTRLEARFAFRILAKFSATCSKRYAVRVRFCER
jgi:hypothetical protein